MLDRYQEKILKLLYSSKSSALQQLDDDEDLYNDLLKSKAGNIIITKISNNKGYLRQGDSEYGLTLCFGEGLSCYMSNIDKWYYTSVIQETDWEKKEFTTFNSTYRFSFEELDRDELYKQVKEHYESTSN